MAFKLKTWFLHCERCSHCRRKIKTWGKCYSGNVIQVDTGLYLLLIQVQDVEVFTWAWGICLCAVILSTVHLSIISVPLLRVHWCSHPSNSNYESCLKHPLSQDTWQKRCLNWAFPCLVFTRFWACACWSEVLRSVQWFFPFTFSNKVTLDVWISCPASYSHPLHPCSI